MPYFLLALFRKEGAVRRRRVFYKSNPAQRNDDRVRGGGNTRHATRATLFAKEGFGAKFLRYFIIPKLYAEPNKKSRLLP